MNKIIMSGVLDFIITAGTAFVALPDAPLTLRQIAIILVGSAVATAKGLRTYYAEYPKKMPEVR